MLPTTPARMARLAGLACVFLASAIAPPASEATPQFARQHQLRCTACHLLPPKLNENGLAFQASGYVLSEQLRRQRRVEAGAPGFTTFPFAAWITGRFQDQGSGGASDLSLAVGVESLWEQWQQDRLGEEEALAGRRSVRSHDRSVFLLRRGGSDRLVALVGGPGFLERQLLGQDPLQGLLARQRIRLALDDSEGRPVLSQISETQAQDVLRTMAGTRLPWTLRVVDADPTSGSAQLAGRRRLLLGGMGLVALLVVAGSYFSARAMTRELETARLQSDFVAAVSHEFRTPLTSLRQFTDLLADGRRSSQEDRDQYYGALRRGTQRLTRLVENLLDFGRMDAGSHEFTLQALPAKDLVQRVVAEFQEEVRNRGYRVDVGWHGDEAVVQGDAAALERALWNLLDNALKYSPRCKTIWVTAEVEDGRLVISVRDQGIGIPTEEQRNVFRKFVRGSAATASAVKGTGLGLTLVQQIVQAHGGQVRLESQPGAGSTFSIVLPTQR